MFFRRYCYIYNSRNYRSLLAKSEATDRNLQIYNSRNYRSLLALFHNCSFITVIYNSRNYRSLLAALYKNDVEAISTIVEIIEAYQPQEYGKRNFKQIYNSRNYRSLLAKPIRVCVVSQIYNSRNYRSLLAGEGFATWVKLIYNSRNYRSLLASNLARNSCPSTIVEIIEAYQPVSSASASAT